MSRDLTTILQRGLYLLLARATTDSVTGHGTGWASLQSPLLDTPGLPAFGCGRRVPAVLSPAPDTLQTAGHPASIQHRHVELLKEIHIKPMYDSWRLECTLAVAKHVRWLMTADSL